MEIFARNFRGFKSIEVDLDRINFLVGDNSSGKTSILHLISSVLSSNLLAAPRLDEDFGVTIYDYFSPYFDDADVTFGYRIPADNGFVAKLLTVRKNRDNTPSLIACTYASHEKAITLRRAGKSVKRKTVSQRTNTISDIYAIHDSSAGYTLMENVPKNMPLSEPALVAITAPRDQRDDIEFIYNVFSKQTPSFAFLGPTRSLPAKYYNFDRTVHASGLHFASMWRDLERRQLGRYRLLVARFGREGKLFDGFDVRPISAKLRDSPLIVSVKRNGKEFLLNQVGVGVSQVVPILVETVFSVGSKYPRIGLFQQPELHLHPIAQAALGSFFFKVAQEGFKGVLETHSSYLIDRYRAEVRDQREQKAARPAIIFCENSGDSNIATTILVSQDGKLIGAPDAYHAFFVDELMRTMF